MKPLSKSILIGISCLALVLTGCQSWQCSKVVVDPDTVLNDVSHHPIGINLNYFMDDDAYLKPERSTVDALKALGVKYLRYPGGNKSDFYFFSTPPYEKSQPTLARTGKGAINDTTAKMLEDYRRFKYDVLDFDEFMDICHTIEAVPVICVAADEYLVDYPKGCTVSDKQTLIQNAVEWVRYANIRKKYNVKYWLIGNESWHKQNKNSTPEIYAQDVVDFSRAMKAVDPSIKIVANGRTIQWWQKVLPICVKDIDYLCVSNYPVSNYKKGYLTYRDNITDLLREVNVARNAIDRFTTGQDWQRLKIIAAEYGSMDWARTWPHINDMGHNLALFEMTGEQLKLPRLEFSCFWNTRWIHNKQKEDSIFDALDKDGYFNANGYSLAIWGNFLGKKMVKTTSTVHIRTFASFDSENKNLFVYIINKSKGPKPLSIDLKGYDVDSTVQRWQLVGKGPKDTQPIWEQIEGPLKSSPLKLTVPGTSITVIEFKLK